MSNPSQAAQIRAVQSGAEYKTRVLSATNIVEIIGSSVVLKKRGKDFIGLCPFHQEKTPSFHVSPAKQMFYCYGCKAGGDVISFVMKRDRQEFRDALDSLARAAGIEPLPRGTNLPGGNDRQKLLDAHSAAATFFENLLASEAGITARDYLRQRGFDQDSIKRFRIGIAPDAWDGLLRSPIMRKFPPPLLATAGLVKARDSGSGFYDTFRNRLMFPIRNESGQTIAFGGRVMPGSSDPAKYLNSPETTLFSKGRCIFGLDLAKQRIVERRTVAVVEGYTDVIMAHQYGVTHVVSVLGTAMTEQHVTVLRRFADKIVLLFDADTAGDLAADRVVELFLTQPVEIAIASMPAGMDPDELLLQRGPEAFETVLSEAADVLTYKWRQLSRQYASEAGDLTGQQKAVQQYLELLAQARRAGPVDPLRWGSALARVSRLTEMPIDDLNRRFKTRKPAKPRLGGRLPSVESMLPPEIAAAQSSMQAVGASQDAEQATPREKRYLNARDRAERWMLGVLLLEPKRWHQVQVHFGVEDFSDPLRRKLAETYWTYQREEGEPVLGELLSSLKEPPLVELAVGLVDEIEELSGSQNSATQSSEGGSESSPEALTSLLDSALDFLARERQQRQQQKQFALLRRTSDEPQASVAQQAATESAPDETAPAENKPAEAQTTVEDRTTAEKTAIFAEFVKNNQPTNLHRLGPIRRARS